METKKPSPFSNLRRFYFGKEGASHFVMPPRPKLLLLDDDSEVIDLFRELLTGLPSQPDVFTATSGARALSILETEPFALLISDLQMPKMDGLQVLTLVRRRFPHLRTAIMTAVCDEQFRARVYAIGVDLFLEKPGTAQETSFFLDCIESLLARGETGGFRGVQSKSLVDLLQLECLSFSSSTLKITNGLLEGKIWVQKGEITDAATETLSGETAFREILSWKTGNFEIQAAEPNRIRTIFASYQGLLLETAQALDEAHAQSEPSANNSIAPGATGTPSISTRFGELKGLEFVVVAGNDQQSRQSWGTANPDETSTWVREMMQRFRSLGERLEAGPLNQVQAAGSQRQLAFASRGEKDFCLSFHRNSSPELVRHNLKTVLSTCAS